MPRRTILPRQYARLDDDTQRRMPSLTVRWGRNSDDVQVGLATPDEGGPGTGQHHVLDYWYGDAPTMTRIGRLVTQSLAGSPVLAGDLQALVISAGQVGDSDSEADLLAAVGRCILDAVGGSTTNGGVEWWTDLDRDGINEAVRTFKTARDQAMGRDE